jgi:hypothetical protein
MWRRIALRPLISDRSAYVNAFSYSSDGHRASHTTHDGQPHHLVGRQCKEGRNAQAAAEAVNRRLVAWKTNKAVSETLGGITIQCGLS